jgi:hypothetical protein
MKTDGNGWKKMEKRNEGKKKNEKHAMSLRVYPESIEGKG